MSPELHDRPSNISRGRVWMFVILAAVTIALGVLYATLQSVAYPPTLLAHPPHPRQRCRRRPTFSSGRTSSS